MSDPDARCPWCKSVLVEDECPTQDCRDCISYFNDLFPDEYDWIDRKVREAVDAEREWLLTQIDGRTETCTCRGNQVMCQSCQALVNLSFAIRARKSEASRRQPVDKPGAEHE